MILASTAPDGGAWNDAALHRLGATSVSYSRDGKITVQPDVDLAGYSAAVAVVAVPASVTRAQAKIQLHRAGLLDTVKEAVAADPEVQIWFDEATLWYRDNPNVIALGETILVGGSLAIDEMFIAAAQIT